MASVSGFSSKQIAQERILERKLLRGNNPFTHSNDLNTRGNTIMCLKTCHLGSVTLVMASPVAPAAPGLY